MPARYRANQGGRARWSECEADDHTQTGLEGQLARSASTVIHRRIHVNPPWPELHHRSRLLPGLKDRSAKLNAERLRRSMAQTRGYQSESQRPALRTHRRAEVLCDCVFPAAGSAVSQLTPTTRSFPANDDRPPVPDIDQSIGSRAISYSPICRSARSLQLRDHRIHGGRYAFQLGLVGYWAVLMLHCRQPEPPADAWQPIRR